VITWQYVLSFHSWVGVAVPVSVIVGVVDNGSVLGVNRVFGSTCVNYRVRHYERLTIVVQGVGSVTHKLRKRLGVRVEHTTFSVIETNRKRQVFVRKGVE